MTTSIDGDAAHALPDLAKRPQVADFLGVSVPTLARWAMGGTGPKFIKLGSAVRYRKADVLSYIDELAAGTDASSRRGDGAA